MRIAICNDKLEQREQWLGFFAGLSTEAGLELEFASYKSGDHLLFNEEEIVKYVSIIIMGIKMSTGVDGIEAAKQLREKGYDGEIIFFTTMKEEVYSAFDVRAFNFIIKDETPEKKIKEIFFRAVDTAAGSERQHVLLCGTGQCRSIAIKEIAYFEIMKKLMTVHYATDKTFSFSSTMDNVEELFLDKGFVRISRSYLVSLKEIETFSYDKVILRNGDILPVGRKYYAALKEKMLTLKNQYVILKTECASSN